MFKAKNTNLIRELEKDNVSIDNVHKFIYDCGYVDKESGRTALMFAAYINRPDIIEIILNAPVKYVPGGMCSSKSVVKEAGYRNIQNGETAFQIAALDQKESNKSSIFSFRDCLKLLAPYELGLKNYNEETALIMAVKRGNVEVAEEILRLDISSNLTENNEAQEIEILDGNKSQKSHEIGQIDKETEMTSLEIAVITDNVRLVRALSMVENDIKVIRSKFIQQCNIECSSLAIAILRCNYIWANIIYFFEKYCIDHKIESSIDKVSMLKSYLEDISSETLNCFKYDNLAFLNNEAASKEAMKKCPSFLLLNDFSKECHCSLLKSLMIIKIISTYENGLIKLSHDMRRDVVTCLHAATLIQCAPAIRVLCDSPQLNRVNDSGDSPLVLAIKRLAEIDVKEKYYSNQTLCIEILLSYIANTINYSNKTALMNAVLLGKYKFVRLCASSEIGLRDPLGRTALMQAIVILSDYYGDLRDRNESQAKNIMKAIYYLIHLKNDKRKKLCDEEIIRYHQRGSLYREQILAGKPKNIAEDYLFEDIISAQYISRLVDEENYNGETCLLSNSGYTALMVAAACNNIPCVKALKDYEAGLRSTSDIKHIISEIHSCNMNCFVNKQCKNEELNSDFSMKDKTTLKGIVKELYKPLEPLHSSPFENERSKFVSTNGTYTLGAYDHTGSTASMIAAEMGYLEVLKILLPYEAGLFNKIGCSIFSTAVINNRVDVLEFLMDEYLSQEKILKCLLYHFGQKLEKYKIAAINMENYLLNPVLSQSQNEELLKSMKKFVETFTVKETVDSLSDEDKIEMINDGIKTLLKYDSDPHNFNTDYDLNITEENNILCSKQKTINLTDNESNSELEKWLQDIIRNETVYEIDTSDNEEKKYKEEIITGNNKVIIDEKETNNDNIIEEKNINNNFDQEINIEPVENKELIKSESSNEEEDLEKSIDENVEAKEKSSKLKEEINDKKIEDNDIKKKKEKKQKVSKKNMLDEKQKEQEEIERLTKIKMQDKDDDQNKEYEESIKSMIVKISDESELPYNYHYHVTRYLLAEIIYPTAEKNTVLTLAARYGHTNVVEFILKNDVLRSLCIRRVNSFNRTALMEAVVNGNIRCVKLLAPYEHSKHDLIGMNALSLASGLGICEAVAILAQYEGLIKLNISSLSVEKECCKFTYENESCIPSSIGIGTIKKMISPNSGIAELNINKCYKNKQYILDNYFFGFPRNVIFNNKGNQNNETYIVNYLNVCIYGVSDNNERLTKDCKYSKNGECLIKSVKNSIDEISVQIEDVIRRRTFSDSDAQFSTRKSLNLSVSAVNNDYEITNTISENAMENFTSLMYAAVYNSGSCIKSILDWCLPKIKNDAEKAVDKYIKTSQISKSQPLLNGFASKFAKFKSKISNKEEENAKSQDNEIDINSISNKNENVNESIQFEKTTSSNKSMDGDEENYDKLITESIDGNSDSEVSENDVIKYANYIKDNDITYVPLDFSQKKKPKIPGGNSKKNKKNYEYLIELRKKYSDYAQAICKGEINTHLSQKSSFKNLRDLIQKTVSGSINSVKKTAGVSGSEFVSQLQKIYDPNNQDIDIHTELIKKRCSCCNRTALLHAILGRASAAVALLAPHEYGEKYKIVFKDMFDELKSPSTKQKYPILMKDSSIISKLNLKTVAPESLNTLLTIPDSYTALMVAAATNNVDAVSYLIPFEAGKKSEIQKVTALNIALEFGNYESALLLSLCDEEIYSTDCIGRNVLHRMQDLFVKGCFIDEHSNQEGQHLFMLISLYMLSKFGAVENKDIVDNLINNIEQNVSKEFIDLAKSVMKCISLAGEIVHNCRVSNENGNQRLLRNTDIETRTPLHKAVLYFNLPLVAMNVYYGDLFHETCTVKGYGCTALALSVASGFIGGVELLVKHELSDLIGYEADETNTDCYSNSVNEIVGISLIPRTILHIDIANELDNHNNELYNENNITNTNVSNLLTNYESVIGGQLIFNAKADYENKLSATKNPVNCLLFAVMLENYGCIEILQNNGMMEFPESGVTSLMIASFEGDISKVRKLIRYQIGMKTTKENITALMFAAQQGLDEIVAMLQNNKEEICTIHSITKEDVLMMTVKAGKHTTIDTLINGTPDCPAPSQHREFLIQNYNVTTNLANGVEVPPENMQHDMTLPSAAQNAYNVEEDGYYAIHYAVYYNKPKCVASLIRKQARRQTTKKNMTALMLAIQKDYSECISILIERECGLQDIDGNTATMYAVNSKSSDSVLSAILEYQKSLVEITNSKKGKSGFNNKSKYNIKDKQNFELGRRNKTGATALINAIRIKNTAAASCIIDDDIGCAAEVCVRMTALDKNKNEIRIGTTISVDQNEREENIEEQINVGWSALMVATRVNLTEIQRKLIPYEKELQYMIPSSTKGIDSIEEWSRLILSEVDEQTRVDPDEDAGSTAAHIAIKGKKMNSIANLLRYAQSEFTVPDLRHKTPIDYALELESNEIYTLIEKCEGLKAELKQKKSEKEESKKQMIVSFMPNVEIAPNVGADVSSKKESSVLSSPIYVPSESSIIVDPPVSSKEIGAKSKNKN